MNKFIALALVTFGITVSARAQWIVYDPANTVQSVINTAQEIAKFVQMINNQVPSCSQRFSRSSTTFAKRKSAKR